jgi:hypothetical protein
MGIRHLPRNLLIAVGLVLAPVVSGCDGGGGPSQGSCLSISDGSALQTQAFIMGNVLTVKIFGDSSSPFLWKSAFVSSLFNVNNGTVQLPGNGEPTQIQSPVQLTLYLPQPGPTTGQTSGQFTFEALVANPRGSTCTIQRVYGFILAGGQVTLF